MARDQISHHCPIHSMEIHLRWMNFSSHWATTKSHGDRIRKGRRPVPTPLQQAPKTVPPGTGLHHAQADSYPACLHTSFERRSKLVRVSTGEWRRCVLVRALAPCKYPDSRKDEEPLARWHRPSSKPLKKSSMSPSLSNRRYFTNALTVA